MLLQNAAAALPERPLSISDASAGQWFPFMSTSEQSVASGSSDVWTVQRILQWTAEFLRQKGVESPRVEAELLLAHARGCNRIRLYTDFNEPLSDAHRAQMRELVRRRAAREPLAYLVGAKEFYGRRFRVSPAVLIPRPETENLVDCCLDQIADQTDLHVLEVGAGSGCIAVTLLLQKPTLQMTATELCPEAIQVAAENAEQYGIADRLQLLQGSVLEPVPVTEQRYHGLVSNPPYIRDDELAGLAPEVREHEPRLALCSGTDGLDVVRAILQQCPPLLHDGAFLALELDPAQCERVCELAAAAGFTDARILPDNAGLNRIVAATWRA